MKKAEKRTKTRMVESAELAQALMRCPGLGIYIVRDGKFQYANALFQELTGYTEQELRDIHPLDMVHPEDRELVREKAIENLKGHSVLPYEYRFIRKNGEIMWILEGLASMRYRGKQAAVGSFMDITDSKRMEEALAEEAMRRRMLMENSIDGISVLDENCKLVEANKQFADILGYSPEEVRELHVWDWDTDHTREQVLEMARTVDEVGHHFETRHRRKDGTYFDVELCNNGVVVGGKKLIFCVSRDITDRKRMESDLSSSRDQLDRVINSMVEVLMVMDTDYNIIDVNRSFLEYYGGERKDIVGRKCYDVIYQLSKPCSGKQRHCPMQTVLQAGKPFSAEHIYKTVEGREFTFELSMFPLLDSAGNIEAVVEMQHDVTERKQAEEALRCSEQNFRDSIENSPLGIRVLDSDGNKTVYANRALLDMWGYSSVEELEAVPRKQRYTPQTYAEHLERLEKRRRGEPAPLSYETGIVRSDGEARILSVSRGELMWNGEKRFQIVSRDITEYKQLEEALAKSEERYRTVLEQMDDAYFETDIAGNYTFVNDALCSQSGYSREEMMGMNYRVYTPEDEAPRVYKAFNRVYKTGRPIKGVPMGRIKKGGMQISTETSAFPLRNESGKIIGFRGITRDVTERAHMIQALSQSEERYRTVLEQMEEAYYETDIAGKFTFCNDAMCRQLGYSREDLIGMSFKVITPPEEVERIFGLYNQVYRTGEPLASVPIERIRKDGTRLFVDSSIFPLRDESGEIIGFRGIAADVTERRHFEQKLAEMATHDALTGLPNRTLLSDRFTVALELSRRTGNRLAVMMLDLDRFKAVNDSMGHDVGDKLLKAVGRRLKVTMRKSDTVARIGGDEFVVLLPQIPNADEVAKFAQRILQAFREPFVFNGYRPNITTSIGIAVYPKDGRDIENLLKNADTAMYWAKEQGRDIYRFYDGSEAATLLAKRRLLCA
jgi:diguanylate cyclase (GGDEF)-like protein/PAS domain S-box-containing protein